MVIWSSGAGSQENYVMFGNNYWWLSNNLLGRWNQWDSLCSGINHDTPSLVLYYNGKMYDEKVFEDKVRKVQFEASVNASYFDSPMATDIFIGCAPFQAIGHETFGYITNVHMFNRILTHNEMVSMTDCP